MAKSQIDNDLLPILWHPSTWKDLCMKVDEKKEITKIVEG